MNKNVVMAILSAAGTVSTAILSVKAYKRIKEADDLTPNQFVETLAIPVAAGIATVGLIFANQVSNSKKTQNVSAIYAGVATTFAAYRGKIAERFGTDVDNDIYEQISNECLGCWNTRADSKEEVLTFYDPRSDRYFERSWRFVQEAAYHLNRNYALGGYVSLNDYYEFLDLPTTVAGNDEVWTWDDIADYGYSWIDIIPIRKIDANGNSYFELYMPFEPHLYAVGDSR